LQGLGNRKTAESCSSGFLFSKTSIAISNASSNIKLHLQDWSYPGAAKLLRFQITY